MLITGVVGILLDVLAMASIFNYDNDMVPFFTISVFVFVISLSVVIYDLANYVPNHDPPDSSRSGIHEPLLPAIVQQQARADWPTLGPIVFDFLLVIVFQFLFWVPPFILFSIFGTSAFYVF